MDIQLIEKIAKELNDGLTGKMFGRIYALSRQQIAIDVRPGDGRLLFISCEPAAPRVYFIRRRLRDIEKAAGGPTAFSQILRSRLGGAIVNAVDQMAGERVLEIRMSAVDELGRENGFYLVLQMTGRSANVFLLDKNRVIIDSMRETQGRGQQRGDIFSPPERLTSNRPERRFEMPVTKDLSEFLDEHYLEKAAAERFRALVAAARGRNAQEIKKRRRLLEKLERDMGEHGNADSWKHLGDLLLANTATAERVSAGFRVTDYFAEDAPLIVIEADDNETITAAAERYFRRYTKARNGREAITGRMAEVAAELGELEKTRQLIETAAESGDDVVLAELAADKRREPTERKGGGKKESRSTGYRSFVSADGFEILVGKRSKDNDHLTFRVARSLDTWLHAADYPGSHVVIRNPNRKEIPPTTLLQAAELAAFYSDARHQIKAAVNYTLRKFVNKPRGGAAGLVSLSSFKTLLVEPKVNAEAI